MVLGHEPSGVVLKAGAGVTGLSEGDRFALEPGIACGHCEMCRLGRMNLCDNMRFMSSGGIPGFFCERINIPSHNLIPVPKHVGLKEATLIEPIAVALHSLTFAAIRQGETAVVFGTGPIGLLTIARSSSGARRDSSRIRGPHDCITCWRIGRSRQGRHFSYPM